MNLNQVFQAMWEDYLAFNPHAREVYQAFTAEGEQIVNDHIALRTYKLSPLSLRVFTDYFSKFGYIPKGEYHFKEKKLYAVHLEKEGYPKVFISELLVDQLSSGAQKIISQLVSQMPESFLGRPDLPWAGRPWTLSSEQFQLLAKESEYAAWVAAHGFRPNHFTVSVNHLKKFTSIEAVNHFLQNKGFVLNDKGGLIKGSPAVFLEQSSTMAGNVKVVFSDGVFEVPACYYEFAKRYMMPNGQLYQGFVETSADKIFESTDRSKTI